MSSLTRKKFERIRVPQISKGVLSTLFAKENESKQSSQTKNQNTMKRKTLTPFVMFAFFVITLLMTSCNKTEALPEQNEAPSLSAQLQELVQDVPQSALTMRGSSSFDAIGFPASPAQGELGTSFTFIFKGSPANGFEAFDLYVRFVAPDGSSPTPIAMRKMPREGDYAVFRLDRTLQQVGLYYYEYVYYYGGSYRQMLGTTQQTV